jgi:hypothetical protein
MNEVFKCRDWRMMKWVEEWTKAQAWGCPRGTPSSSANIRSPFKTLYFYCLMHYTFFLERLYFSFQFCLVFVCWNKWLDPNKFLLEEIYLLFIYQEHSVFHSYRSTSVSFSRTAFSFCFSPWFLFRSCYIFISRCILTTGLCWFSSKELFQKGSNGVGKEKKFHAKKWHKNELV